jgi:hypothetical protein
MAISPVSDIILDVAQAADPRKASATTQALAAGADASGDFAATLNRLPASAPVFTAYHDAGAVRTAALTPAQKAARGLESALLKTFVDQMLPKDATAVFGGGVAGDVWKSMLSEKIADQVAQSGALKIADRLFQTHPDLLKSPHKQQIGASLPMLPPQTKLKI